MSVTSTVYAVTPAQLTKLREDNELLAALFGDDEDAEETFDAPRFAFHDFEDTHRLLYYAGHPALHDILDFELGSDETLDDGERDIRVATPAQVKKIAADLAKVTLEQVREKGLAAEFKTDRRNELLRAEDYTFQFSEIEKTRAFFAAAAKAGHAVIAAAG